MKLGSVTERWLDKLKSGLYAAYFGVTSIPAIAELDWAVRRYLAAKAGLGSSRKQMKLIHQLAGGRGIGLSPRRAAGELPDSMDIIVYTNKVNTSAEVGPTLACLERVQGGSCAFHVWQITASAGTSCESTSFRAPGSLLETKVHQAPNIEQAVASGSAPLLLVVSDNIAPEPALIKRALTDSATDTEDTVWWEYCPTLGERPDYIDPVTLRIAHSRGDCVAFRRPAPATLNLLSGHRDHPTDWLASLSEQYHTNGRSLVNRTPWATEYYSSLSAEKGPKPTATPKATQVRLRPFSPFELGNSDAPAIGNPPTIKLPLVSVIIRTFPGRGAWLQESAQSALNQSYPNLEIIIAEDGEPSHSHLIGELNKKLVDSRFLTYLAKGKQGKSKTGNHGLASASGQFLMFLDDDDLLYPAHVELLIRHLLASPGTKAAYGLAFEVHTRIDDTPGQYEEVFYCLPKMMLRNYSRENLERDNLFPIQTVIFERSLYEELGGFDPEKQYLEDWDLWLRYASKTQFLAVPVVTSLYRTPAKASERVARTRNPKRRTPPAGATPSNPEKVNTQ
ncbi:glycosyltransferase [Parahaliea aestuarii]|nr:glycosyltransferase [Parahaliea aestuarii]